MLVSLPTLQRAFQQKFNSNFKFAPQRSWPPRAQRSSLQLELAWERSPVSLMIFIDLTIVNYLGKHLSLTKCVNDNQEWNTRRRSLLCSVSWLRNSEPGSRPTKTCHMTYFYGLAFRLQERFLRSWIWWMDIDTENEQRNLIIVLSSSLFPQLLTYILYFISFYFYILFWSDEFDLLHSSYAVHSEIFYCNNRNHLRTGRKSTKIESKPSRLWRLLQNDLWRLQSALAVNGSPDLDVDFNHQDEDESESEAANWQEFKFGYLLMSMDFRIR